MFHINGINVDNDDFDFDAFIADLEDRVDSQITMETEWCDEAPSKQCIAISEFGAEDADGEFPWAWSKDQWVDMWSCEAY